MLQATQGSDYFAYTGTGTAGDVNGDGYGDVIVSAAEYSADQAEEGRAYLYYGSASGLMSTPGWTVEGNQAVAHLGYGWPAAGDVNGDGYADIILGAPLFDAGGHDEGAALLYYGGPAGPSATADWRVEGSQADANFGVSARPAGDLNGDGYADVVVGAYRYDSGETDEGAAFVYYGSAAGLKAVPGLTIEANQAAAHLGDGAGTAGDVNGDGYSDLIVNAGGYDSGYTDEGAAFVYHGGPDGLSATADWRTEGNQQGAYLGYFVSTAGDVNGDGFDDTLVGAPAYDNGETDEGRAFLYYGSAAGLGSTPAWMVEANQVGAASAQSAQRAMSTAMATGM